MIKNLLSSLISGSLLFSFATPTFAQSAEFYDPFEHYGYQSGVTGGIYVKVPFNGRLKRSSNSEVRFGLALKAKFPRNFSYAQSYQYSFAASNTQEIKFLDLSIGPSGFKSFKLNGQSFKDMKRIYADGDDEKEGMSTGTKVLIGVGVAAAVFLAVIIIAGCTNDTSLDGCD